MAGERVLARDLCSCQQPLRNGSVLEGGFKAERQVVGIGWLASKFPVTRHELVRRLGPSVTTESATGVPGIIDQYRQQCLRFSEDSRRGSNSSLVVVLDQPITTQNLSAFMRCFASLFSICR